MATARRRRTPAVDSNRRDNVQPIGARAATPYLYTERAQTELALALTSLSDPDEVLRKAGIPRSSLRKLESDDEIASALDTRQEAAIGSLWSVQSDASAGPAAESIADRIWRDMEPHMETLMRGAWEALPYGYSVTELTYADKPDFIGIDKVSIKPFHWFDPMPDGRLMYKPQNGTPEEVPWRVNLLHDEPELRVPKFCLARRNPSYEQPQGRALLSRLYWAWFMRERGWRFWAKFLERHGSPTLVGYVAAQTGEAQDAYSKRLDEMLESLAAAHHSAVMAAGAGDKIEQLQASSAGDAYDKFEGAVNKRVQKVILGQTLTSDVTKVGSYAASKTHNLVREDRRHADLRMVAGALQHVVDALTLLNFGPNVPSPTMKLETERGVQIERATRDAELLRSGLPLTKTYFVRNYGFEEDEIDADDAIIVARPDGTAQAQLAANLGTAAGIERLVMGQQASLDRLVAKVAKRAGQPLDIDDVTAAIRGADNPEQLTERLLALVPHELADDDAMRTLTERAMFAADIMGYVQSEEQ